MTAAPAALKRARCAGTQRGADEQRVGQGAFHQAHGLQTVFCLKDAGKAEFAQHAAQAVALGAGRIRDDRRLLPRRHGTPLPSAFIK